MSNPLSSAQSYQQETPTSGVTLSATRARGSDTRAATEPLQPAPTGEADSPLSALAPLARLVARRAVRQQLRVRRRGYTIIQIPIALALVAILLAAALILSHMLGGR